MSLLLTTQHPPGETLVLMQLIRHTAPEFHKANAQWSAEETYEKYITPIVAAAHMSPVGKGWLVLAGKLAADWCERNAWTGTAGPSMLYSSATSASLLGAVIARDFSCMAI